MGTTNRTEVYAAIDSERDYQNELSSFVLTIGEELLLLEEYISRARKTWTEEFTQPEVETLRAVRKIAGIATRCMEHHGAHNRC